MTASGESWWPPAGLALVLETSGAGVFCGLLEGGNWRASLAVETAPLEGLAGTVRAVLGDAGVGLTAVGGFIVGIGPGSILGLRLAAVMVNGWRVLEPWASSSLHLFPSLPAAAACLHGAGRLPAGAWLVSPARQGSWNRWQSASQRLDVVPTEGLLASSAADSVPIFQLPARKLWQQPAADCPVLAVPWGADASWLATPGLCQSAMSVQLATVDSPTYRTWTPLRHGSEVLRA